MAGRSRNPSPSTHNHTAQPSQERRGTGGARTQTHTDPSTPARSGGAQPKLKPKHTHPPCALQPGVAGYKRTCTQTHTHPNTPARSGRAQPRPKPKHTHPHRTAKPGVAGYKESAQANTQTPQNRSSKWRGAAETRTQAHTPTRHIPARSGRVQAERAHKHTHNPTPEPGVAGYKRSAHTNTHTPQHPSQEWPGAAETRPQAHISTPHTPTRSGGVQAERVHSHTQTPTPEPAVAGRNRNPSPSTHTHTAHPSQEWRGTGGARRQTHTLPNTPARSGGAQPKHEPKHTHPHRTPEPGMAGYRRSAHTTTHAPKIQPGMAGCK